MSQPRPGIPPRSPSCGWCRYRWVPDTSGKHSCCGAPASGAHVRGCLFPEPLPGNWVLTRDKRCPGHKK